MFAGSNQFNRYGPQSIVRDLGIPPKVSLSIDDLIAPGQRPLRFNSGLMPYSAARPRACSATCSAGLPAAL